MNETINPDSSAGGSETPPPEPPPLGSSPRPDCFSERVRRAFDEGAQGAKALAEEAAPRIKEAVSDATYWVGYGLSFATIFSYTLMTELAPQVLKSGCRDGAQAGRRAAEEAASELKGRPYASP